MTGPAPAGRVGVPGVLDPALRDRPDATAVVARSGSLTYAELDAAADDCAAALWSLGVRPGDRVAACLPNDLDVVTAFHGTMRVGALWVGVGEALAPPEKEFVLRDCAASVLLAPAQVVASLPSGPWRPVVVGPGEEWAQRVRDGGAVPEVVVDVHAPAGIAYTSGTTGRPKGVVHSQHNLLLPGQVLVATRGWGPELRKGDCLPLTILNMMVLTTLLTAQAQGCCIVMDRRDADGIAEWVGTAGITHWNGVPAQLFDLARHAPGSLSSLVEVWSGGGDCPDALRVAFREAHGLTLRATYGLTEAPTVVSIDPVGDEWHPAASGRVLAHLDVRAHADDGGALPAGDVGELRLRARADGPWAHRWTPPLGSWEDGGVRPGDPHTVATGDLGSVDHDGWLRVVDRRKLVIVRGGANVYPAEVERVLHAQPGVAGAAVFPVPDPRLGERVAALVQPEPGAALSVDALREVCLRELARYKVPEEWGIVDALPRNAMGKVVRPGLPELLSTKAERPVTEAAGGKRP